MKKLALVFILMVFCVAPLMGCGSGNVCEEAAALLLDCPNAPEVEGGGGGATVGGEDCNEDAQCLSQCFVDNPEASCESLEEMPDPETVQPLADCFFECPIAV